ncbi:MAG: arginine--tRNA ligase [candidate division SR1 bacterium]|nr:arginine--tRNA ligase [candidate division SR1 bacterium]
MIGIYKKYFAEILAKNIDLPVEEILTMIEIPPENIPGDLAFPCFQLAKQAKQAPNILAQQFAEKFSSEYFEKFQAVGGYVNAHINKTSFIQEFFTIKHQKPIAKQSTKVLIEYMSANPNKPLHIGQARNVCVGDSMRRIYEYLGYTPTTCDYGDDSGVNIGYNIVGHLYYDIPVTTEKKFDHYCGEIYEKMRGLSEDPMFMKRLTETLLKIEEATDPEINILHQKYTQDCTQQQMVSCWRMGAYFDLVVRETHILHLKFFAEAMSILKEKGFVKFADEGDAKGCRILDLSSLPEYAKEEKQYQIMIKSDGLATYVAKDIALAMWKLGYMNKDFGYEQSREDPRGVKMYTTSTDTSKGKNHGFGKYDEAVTVIDYRQIPPQNIVASALKLLGHIQGEKKYLPLGYGIVFLTPQTLLNMKFKLSEEEKLEKRLPFASRKGWTVTIDDMLDMLHKKAYFETKERNPDKDDTRLDKVAESMAISALRFFLIRGDITKDIVFDLDEAMDMKGETGTYILYTGARIQSIIDSVGTIATEKIDYSLLQEEEEFSLIKKISTLDEIVVKAKEELAPHYIAKYCFDLAQLVNSYYAHTKIVVDDEKTKIARTALLHNVLETLQKTMKLIGMIFVERM